MTIESISGVKRYRVCPQNPMLVQVQEKHKAKWQVYRACQSAAEATQLVLSLGKNVKGK